jgi:hypothetical protein
MTSRRVPRVPTSAKGAGTRPEAGTAERHPTGAVLLFPYSGTRRFGPEPDPREDPIRVDGCRRVPGFTAPVPGGHPRPGVAGDPCAGRISRPVNQ